MVWASSLALSTRSTGWTWGGGSRTHLRYRDRSPMPTPVMSLKQPSAKNKQTAYHDFLRKLSGQIETNQIKGLGFFFTSFIMIVFLWLITKPPTKLSHPSLFRTVQCPPVLSCSIIMQWNLSALSSLFQAHSHK